MNLCSFPGGISTWGVGRTGFGTHSTHFEMRTTRGVFWHNRAVSISDTSEFVWSSFLATSLTAHPRRLIACLWVKTPERVGRVIE